MPAPVPSKLDYGQTLQGAFDEATGRFRVDAQISASIITPPGLEVSISSLDDSIRVVGTEDGTQTGTQHVLKVGSDLNLRVKDDTANTTLTTINSNLVIIQGKQDTGNLSVSSIDGKLVDNYGIATDALRTASQIGNSTGAANFGAGATGAQTLRVSANLSDGAGTALTSTLFNSKQSLDIRPNNGFSTGSSTTPTINNVSSVVLAANTNRKYAYVFNQTGVVIYLKLGATAVIGEGIRLVNNSMFEILDSNLWTGTITAIKSGATGVALDIFEGT